MGRFHYWLGTGQVTKFRPMLHRPPFDVLVGWHVGMIFVHILFAAEYSHIEESLSSILSYQNLTMNRTFVLGYLVPLWDCLWDEPCGGDTFLRPGS